MKVTTFLLFAMFFQVSAAVFSQNSGLISLKADNESVKEILLLIEDQSKYRFLYNSNNIDVEQKKSIDCQAKSIEEVLDMLLKGTDIKYRSFERNYVLYKGDRDMLMPAINLVTSSQQPGSISGKVTDTEGQPLPGVSIVIKGTTQGTATNTDGEYSLTNVPLDATLVFSFVGMKTQEVRVGSQTNINITMEEEVIGIEEVVAIGYGTMKKSDLTGSVTNVDISEARPVQDVNLAESLQGQVPGLNISMGSGAPGANPELLIRGQRSLSASNAPLIVVDGFPFQGSLNEINTTDIESVSVLKDVSASAIYGARAANGVILITTKSGGNKNLEISVNSNISFEQPLETVDLMNGEQYIKKLTDVADFLEIEYDSPRDLLQERQYDQYDANTQIDWFDLVFDTGVKALNTISLKGKTEKTTFYNSVSALNHSGVLDRSSFDRFNIVGNMTHNFNDWLSYTSNIRLSQSDNGAMTPWFGNVPKLSPYGKLKDDDGNYERYPQFPETFIWNPYANDGATKDEISRNVFLKQGLEFSPKFVPGLSYKLDGALNYLSYEYGAYYPKNTYDGEPNNGYASTNKTNRYRWLVENLLKYNISFNNHNIDLTALFSREESGEKGESIAAFDFPVSDENLYHYIQSAESLSRSGTATWMNRTAIQSVMGRINYNYNNRYYISGTYRQDGYSGFAENKKFASFPSVAVAWNISNEDFFQGSSLSGLVNLLKIRVSYGDAGNMGISPYSTLDRYNVTNYVFGSTTAIGALTGSVGNKFLSWETTRSLNLGLEFYLFNQRLYGNLDMYQSRTFDLLMARTVPIMNGYSTIMDNIGETKNRGLELSLNSVNVDTGNLKWTSNLNFFMYRDEITKLREGETEDLGNGWFVGEPISSIYDYNMIGVFKSQEEIDASHMPSSVPGGAILEDADDSGDLTVEDKKIIGVERPLWTANLMNTFTYKSFEAGFQLYTVQKTLRENSIINPGSYESDKKTNYPVLDYWTPDNPGAEYVNPGYDKKQIVNHGFYQDASFLRIKSIHTSYNFNHFKGIRNLKLILECKNVYTFTNWIGYDPEAWGSFMPYPNPRVYTLGINLNF